VYACNIKINTNFRILSLKLPIKNLIHFIETKTIIFRCYVPIIIQLDFANNEYTVILIFKKLLCSGTILRLASINNMVILILVADFSNSMFKKLLSNDGEK